MLYVNLKITWIIERQSYENALSLVKSAWIWTIQLKFISHFSIGSKAARDKVNQIAHVRKSRGSLGLQTWRLIENVLRRLSRKSGYFQCWLIYSNAFVVLNARGKLNIVFLSCERKCWTTLFKVVTKNVLWTLFMLDKLSGTENWLNWSTLNSPRPRHLQL